MFYLSVYKLSVYLKYRYCVWKGQVLQCTVQRQKNNTEMSYTNILFMMDITL